MKLAADVIVVGAGLAGLVAATELTDAGRRVTIVDQEPQSSLGGQAFWSFGGLFFVNSPEQRRLGIRDSHELAWQDWVSSAEFDRDIDYWPRRWAEAYVDFATEEKRAWLRAQGIRIFPLVQWAERRGHPISQHGNSVPRFHVTWGTGPGVLAPFLRRAQQAVERGLLSFQFRHRVKELILDQGAVTGVRGELLAPSATLRGVPSNRNVTGDFELYAQAVIVASGGIGGNHDLVRKNWPQYYGQPPKQMISGVPDYVDGRMLGVIEAAGGSIINADRMWHYPEGIHNHSPVWSNHGIRILSGPSPLWLNALGQRFPTPLFPGFDTVGALSHIGKSGFDYSWFLLNRRIIEREFALSGSEQNPDLTNRDFGLLLQRFWTATPAPVARFIRHGIDFVVRNTVAELAQGMNALVGQNLVEAATLNNAIAEHDNHLGIGPTQDQQVAAVTRARRYIGDRLIRVAAPHRLLDPDAGPLIAVRLSIITRKTLGGAQTDLSGRVLDAAGNPVSGLYAAGEATGFGGGGMHGYRALEGTFLGGCIFSGRTAGRATAAATRN